MFPKGLVVFLRECAFADAGNLEHCAKYLNQTLVTFGFPASLDLFAGDPVVSGFLWIFFFGSGNGALIVAFLRFWC